MAVLFSSLKRFLAFLTAIAALLGLNADTVTVELYANPISGYAWEYSLDTYGVLSLTETHYAPDSASILAGKGGGIRSFTFRAVGSGTVNITFQYVKVIGLERVVASRYIYTYTVGTDGKISLYSIQ